VKALIKEKEEKENVLTYLELINLKKVSLLQSKEPRRKALEAKKKQLMEDHEYKKALQYLQA